MLQKSVQPSIVEKTDKVLVGFFQSFSIFNSSQLFFLVSFLGLIGFLIWFSQPITDNYDDSDESSSSSSKNKKKKSISDKNEDEDSNLRSDVDSVQKDNSYHQKSVQTSSNQKSRNDSKSSKHKIETIYESAAEENSVQDEQTNFAKQAASKNIHHIENIREEEEEEKEEINKIINETIFNKESLIKEEITAKENRKLINEESFQKENIKQLTQQQQQQQQQHHQQQQKQPFDKITQEREDATNDTINKILDDLLVDQNEAYAYSKYDRNAVLEQQDSISSKTDITVKDNDSRNSLLDLYNVKHVHAIQDHFQSLSEISSAIKNAGLENSQLIFGIDFTISNLENGTRTFNGRSLHYCDEEIRNPYQKVIEILGKTLECFDVDGKIPAFGFGDSTTKDRKVFPFAKTGYCKGFSDVLVKYNEILKDIKLSGPTNFAPLIKEAIKIVKETKQYHILVIVADGQVTNERQTRDAIVEASKYALSIIMVGVGDGPWDTMNEFDDSLPKRQFDNFQFVNYHEVIDEADNPDETFALHALMEIPDQYKEIKELKLLNK